MLFCLTGCVNYANMHSTAVPLDPKKLSVTHTSRSLVATHTTQNWWKRFHDTELDQLIETALTDSPTLAIAQNRVQQADQLANTARSSLLPTASADVQVGRERYSAHISYPPPYGGHTYNQALLGLNFQYEFDWWGKNRETLAARLSQADATAADLAAAELVITTSVMNAYFQLQYAKSEAITYQNLYQQQQTLLSIIQDRAKNQIDSDIPVGSALVQMQQSKLAAEQAKSQVELAQHRLAVLIGKNPLTTVIATKTATAKNYSLNLPANLPANLLANRPDILAARARVYAAAHAVNAAKARFFPNVNLQALLSLQSALGWNYLFNANSQDHAIGAAIDLPIFDAGRRRANLGTKYAEYDAAVNQYNQTILNALRETADQITLVRSLRQEKSAQAAALNAMQKNYQLALTRYRSGITDYTHVIAARQHVLQLQATDIQLETQYRQAFVGLVKALGGHYDG